MPASDIVIKGAREHNLRDVDLVLPRNQLICLTGVCGSGKSSLAFDTLYAEGQRRYVESLSSFARQFLGQMPKPDVDYIGGLSARRSRSRRSRAGNNPRSTVGTITEIYDYLRVLYARVGQGHCPQCDRPITAQIARADHRADRCSCRPGRSSSCWRRSSAGRRASTSDLFEDLLKQGFVRARVDGEVVQLTDDLSLDRQMRHDIEVVDRSAGDAGRTSGRGWPKRWSWRCKTGQGESDRRAGRRSVGRRPTSRDAEAAMKSRRSRRRRRRPTPTSKHAANARRSARPATSLFSSDYACTHCGLSFEPPSPQLFSFNSPQGMCPECDGLGEMYQLRSGAARARSRRSRSRKAAIELIGPWKDLGRWRRHIYPGRGRHDGAQARARRRHDAGNAVGQARPTSCSSSGSRAPATSTSRSPGAAAATPQKYGGKFEGIIPELLVEVPQPQEQDAAPAARKVHERDRLPGTATARGSTPQARAVRDRRRRMRSSPTQPARSLPEVCQPGGRRRGRVLQRAGARRHAADDRRRSAQGNPRPAGLPDRRGPGLPDARPHGADALRRRVAAHPPGRADRLRPGRRALHPRRAVDRPASARQRPAARHARRGCATWATRSSSSSTTKTRCGPPTRSSTSAPAPACAAAKSSCQGPAAATSSRAKRSLTGQVPLGREEDRRSRQARRKPATATVCKIVGAPHNNLKNIDVEIPLGAFVCVTGVSGSGKSSLVNDILVEALHRDLNKGEGNPGAHERSKGWSISTS